MLLHRDFLHVWTDSVISHALGEIFSGFTMGLGIFVLTVYLNVVTNPPFLTVDFASGAFRLDGNLWAVLAIVVASLPLVCSIANIMLANNLRDLDTDIENHRYTLVYYIGPIGDCAVSSVSASWVSGDFIRLH